MNTTNNQEKHILCGGIGKTAKKVVCIEVGKIYNGAKEASKAIGADLLSIYINGRKGKYITVDPNDLGGMRQLMDWYGRTLSSSLLGEDEDGNFTMVSINHALIVIETLQANGWARTNIYYYNGDRKELCSKEG